MLQTDKSPPSCALNARQQGRSFKDAVGLSLKAILVSPDFLFRMEADARLPKTTTVATAEKPHLISQYVLASRLSYLLSRSMPGDELLSCADRGTMRRPETLEQEVRRMLKDPRSAGLAQ